MDTQLINNHLFVHYIYSCTSFKEKFALEQIEHAIHWMEEKGIVPN